MLVYEGVTAELGLKVEARVVPDTWGRWHWRVSYCRPGDWRTTRFEEGSCWLLRRAILRALSSSDVVELDMTAIHF